MLFDLPLHPLLAHAPVVLLPLTAVAVIALAFMNRRSCQLVYAVLGLVVVAVVSTVATLLSGNALAEAMGFEPQGHQRWGLFLTISAMVFLLVAVPWLWRVAREGDEPQAATRPLGYGAAAIGVVVMVFTVLAGHSGAEMAWSGVGTAQAESAPEPTPSISGEGSDAGANVATESPADGYTVAAVAEHAAADDCWVIISGNVYDLTEWVAQHPGGSRPITSLCGTDGTSAFEDQHGGQAGPADALEGYLLGPVS